MSEAQRGTSRQKIVELSFGQFVFVPPDAPEGFIAPPPMYIRADLLRKRKNPDGSERFLIADGKRIANAIGNKAFGMKAPQIKKLTLNGFRQIPVSLVCCQGIPEPNAILVVPGQVFDELAENTSVMKLRKQLGKLLGISKP